MNIPRQPWMSKQEIDLILSFLNKEDIMLEYGCGGSTMFFPNYVKEYHSIESDEYWGRSIEKVAPKNVTMHCVPVVRPNDPEQKYATTWDKLYTTKMYYAYKEYIEAGSKIKKVFSKILIDGRARPQCARYIYDFIDNNCIIFIHDWHPCRTHYRSVLEKYKIINEINSGQCLVALSKK